MRSSGDSDPASTLTTRVNKQTKQKKLKRHKKKKKTNQETGLFFISHIEAVRKPQLGGDWER